MAKNDLAALNASLLYALQGDPPESVPALAKALGRDKSNVRKSIDRCADAGLLDAETLQLTDLGRTELERVKHLVEDQGDADPGAAVDGVASLTVVFGQVFASALNPRRDWDSDDARQDLEDLAADIAEHGLIQGLYLKPHPDPDAVTLSTPTATNGVRLPVYEIVAGERRWRAIGLAIAQGKLAPDWPIPARVEAIDELRHRKLALAENIRRRNLNPIEEAEAFKAILDLGGGKTAEIAKDVGATQRMVQQRLQLLQLPAEAQSKLAAGEWTIEDGRREIQRLNSLKLDFLDADALLALAEIYAKGKAEPGSISDQWALWVEIADGCAEDPAFKALYDKNLLHSNFRSYRDGRSYARFSYQTQERLFAAVPGIEAETEVTLKDLRLAALIARGFSEEDARDPSKTGYPGTGWLTLWLRGPFEVPAEVAEERAKAKAEQEAREARHKADMEARKAAEKAREAEGAKAAKAAEPLLQELEAAADLAAANLDRVALQRNFSEAMAALGKPLPWRLTDQGDVFAANGEEVEEAPWQPDAGQLTYLRLKTAAINAQGGFTTPPDFADKECRICGDDDVSVSTSGRSWTHEDLCSHPDCQEQAAADQAAEAEANAAEDAEAETAEEEAA